MTPTSPDKPDLYNGYGLQTKRPTANDVLCSSSCKGPSYRRSLACIPQSLEACSNAVPATGMVSLGPSGHSLLGRHSQKQVQTLYGQLHWKGLKEQIHSHQIELLFLIAYKKSVAIHKSALLYTSQAAKKPL